MTPIRIDVHKGMTIASKEETMAAAYKAFDEAMAAAHIAFNEAMTPAYNAYNETIGPADKAYNGARAAADKVFDEAMAPAYTAFNKAIVTVRKAYDEATAAADKVYDEAIDAVRKTYDEAVAAANCANQKRQTMATNNEPCRGCGEAHDANDTRCSQCPDATTEDASRTPITVGLRVFNYYDRKWGVVTTPPDDQGWFDVEHDDGTSAYLNGARVSIRDPREVGPVRLCGHKVSENRPGHGGYPDPYADWF